MNANTRRAVYAVAVAVIGLMVARRLVTAEEAPLWLALVAALLTLPAPVTALTHVTPDVPVFADTGDDPS